jgi:hypothetical protein
LPDAESLRSGPLLVTKGRTGHSLIYLVTLVEAGTEPRRSEACSALTVLGALA